MPPSPLSTKSRPASPAASSRTPDQDNLRNSANFLAGIKEEPAKAAAFGQAAQQGHDASLRFIAANVNPNRAYGSLLNLGKMAIGGAAALKQNCVYCSTAGDQNLAALASGDTGSFWIADKTSSGTLPQQGSADQSVRKDDQVSTMLAVHIPKGGRGIISVPQRDSPSYNHAMNCVHADDGSIQVIDGQNGKVYDLSKQTDQQAFDVKFGNNGNLCVARFFTTGAAPSRAAQSR